jgi:hypothetical protein
MKTKLIYAGIIAALFALAMIIFHKTMTLREIILAFVGAGSTIGWIWKWISESESKTENNQLKLDFKKANGITIEKFRKENN